MGRIFISYRRSDAAALAGRIYDAMAARFGRKRVFRDTEDIPVGTRFPAFLQQTLHQCQVAFILIGPTWLSATNPDGTRRLDDPHDFVRLEVETALARGLLVCPLREFLFGSPSVRTINRASHLAAWTRRKIALSIDSSRFQAASLSSTKF